MQIQPITAEYAAQLSALSKAIYKEYYLHLWKPGGAEWYQNEYAYHPDILKTELEDPNNHHYMVYENGQPMGYLKIKMNSPLAGHTKEDCLEIERIYLHKAIAGKGVGKQLMQMAEQTAKDAGKKTVFLKAMDSSKEALAFYEKNGYRICGTHTLPFELIKDEYRGMFILSKVL